MKKIDSKDLLLLEIRMMFTSLLIVFVVLKLCGVLNCSWWWVFSPLWFPFALVLLIFLSVLIFETIKKGIRKKGKDE